MRMANGPARLSFLKLSLKNGTQVFVPEMPLLGMRPRERIRDAEKPHSDSLFKGSSAITQMPSHQGRDLNPASSAPGQDCRG
jgi:hypothetical protein